jgi:hypothetical protein
MYEQPSSTSSFKDCLRKYPLCLSIIGIDKRDLKEEENKKEIENNTTVHNNNKGISIS